MYMQIYTSMANFTRAFCWQLENCSNRLLLPNGWLWSAKALDLHIALVVSSLHRQWSLVDESQDMGYGMKGIVDWCCNISILRNSSKQWRQKMEIFEKKNRNFRFKKNIRIFEKNENFQKKSLEKHEQFGKSKPSKIRECALTPRTM